MRVYLNQVWELQTQSLEVVVTYHLTSAPFPLSSGVDHTLFQSFINPRTKSFIPHQSHGVLNDNPMVPNNPEYVQCWRGVTYWKGIIGEFCFYFYLFIYLFHFHIFLFWAHTHKSMFALHLPVEFYVMLISSMMKNYIVLNPIYKRTFVIGGYIPVVHIVTNSKP